jgi:hypothetical protein
MRSALTFAATTAPASIVEEPTGQWRTQACKNGGTKLKKKTEGEKLKKLKN